MSSNLIVVSSDSHVGPRFEDLRPYCPASHLAAFDDKYATAARARQEHLELLDLGAAELDLTASKQSSQGFVAAMHRRELNLRTAGHHDVSTRLSEMDWEGIAAEVVYHGSANSEPFPFLSTVEILTDYADFDRELMHVGIRMYNHWLADFVSHAPERFIGLIYAPMWDIDLAVEEIEWAAARGLRGVNFPAPKPGIREYDDPAWEPFWAACEDLGLTLSTHGGLPPNSVHGPQTGALLRLEAAGWPCRRGMLRMVFGGVFERHPGLHLVLTELGRNWWNHTMREFDTAYGGHGTPTPEMRAQVPRRPSEYIRSNVYIGASFMPPDEVEEALVEGYWTNVIWGRDYPHGEGTYKFPEYDGEPSMTRQTMRHTFSHCPEPQARAMLGENGVRAYRLDRDALAAVASRIGPTADEIARPLETMPAGWMDDPLTY